MSCSDLSPRQISYLAALHTAQGAPYPFPDLEAPEFVAKRALHDESGELVGCVVARRTAELYFFGNPQWRTPRWRLEALKILHEDMRLQLKRQEYKDANCWIPPNIARSFSRRLMRIFGWELNPWLCLSKKI